MPLNAKAISIAFAYAAHGAVTGDRTHSRTREAEAITAGAQTRKLADQAQCYLCVQNTRDRGNACMCSCVGKAHGESADTACTLCMRVNAVHVRLRSYGVGGCLDRGVGSLTHSHTQCNCPVLSA